MQYCDYSTKKIDYEISTKYILEEYMAWRLYGTMMSISLWYCIVDY